MEGKGKIGKEKGIKDRAGERGEKLGEKRGRRGRLGWNLNRFRF